jgi:hypothetical protein
MFRPIAAMSQRLVARLMVTSEVRCEPLAWSQTSANRLVDLYMVPPADRGKYLLMIALPHNGFFDESGTHDDSREYCR